uniref:Hydroxyacylglutathione hydrolase C-terminal domain-containing protein n=1 Tax=Ditylenchus dipsaci TaxID=166011 RepID=A0A915E5Q9_9BILA
MSTWQDCRMIRKSTVGRFYDSIYNWGRKEFNPFMRVNDTNMQKSLGVTGPIEAMAKLREMKNSFRG